MLQNPLVATSAGAGAPVLNKHITTLVNNTIKTSVFPTRLKEAQVVPLHKKK